MENKGAGDDYPIINWYSKNEMFHDLKRQNYSDQIAEELSKKWADDLQGAFNKGFEKAKKEFQLVVEQLKAENQRLKKLK